MSTEDKIYTYFSKALKKLDRKKLMNDLPDLAHTLEFEMIMDHTGEEVALHLYGPPVSHENLQIDVPSSTLEN